jgi:hypothetical protein
MGVRPGVLLVFESINQIIGCQNCAGVHKIERRLLFHLAPGLICRCWNQSEIGIQTGRG